MNDTASSQSAGPIRFADAVSDHPDSKTACDQVLGRLVEQLGEPHADLLIWYATADHRDAMQMLASESRRLFAPKAQLGVTAHGVLGQGREIERMPGLAAMAIKSEAIRFHMFADDDLNWPGSAEDEKSLRAGMLGPNLSPDEVTAIFFFADPFSVPMVHLFPAMNRALPGVPILGGLASAGMQPLDNRLIHQGDVLTQGAVGVALSGPMDVECIVSQGCRPVGQPLVITKAQKNVIQELGGKPVMKVLQTTADELEERDRRLMQHGLIGRVINEYKERFGRGDFLVRNIVGMDPDAGYLAISDLVKVGQTVQFHVRDAQTAEEDLQMMLQSQSFENQPPLGAMLTTCNGRGQHLFEKPHHDTQMILQALGPMPMAGFFAAGEFGQVGGVNFIHGFTASLALFKSQSENQT